MSKLYSRPVYSGAFHTLDHQELMIVDNEGGFWHLDTPPVDDEETHRFWDCTDECPWNCDEHEYRGMLSEMLIEITDDKGDFDDFPRSSTWHKVRLFNPADGWTLNARSK